MYYATTAHPCPVECKKLIILPQLTSISMAMESDHEQNSTTEVHFKQHLRGLRESKCSSSAGKPNDPSGTRMSFKRKRQDCSKDRKRQITGLLCHGFCPGYRAKVLEIAWGKKNSSSKMSSKKRHQRYFCQKQLTSSCGSQCSADICRYKCGFDGCIKINIVYSCPWHPHGGCCSWWCPGHLDSTMIGNGYGYRNDKIHISSVDSIPAMIWYLYYIYIYRVCIHNVCIPLKIALKGLDPWFCCCKPCLPAPPPNLSTGKPPAI